MMYHLYFRRYVNFLLRTYCNWTVDDPIFALIFCERSTYFLELIVLILLKMNLSVRNNFLLMMNMFTKEFWSQIYVFFFFEIYAIPTMCTPYYPRIRELVRISHRTFGFCFSDVTYFRDVAVTEQRINTGITS